MENTIYSNKTNIIEILKRRNLYLNEYNKKFLEFVDVNRYSIILNSEDTDIHRSYALYLIHYIMKPENKDNIIYIITAKDFDNDVYNDKSIRKHLLELSKILLLKIDIKKEKLLKFFNGVMIRFITLHKHIGKNSLINQDEKVNLLIGVNLGVVNDYIFKRLYSSVIPYLSVSKNSQIIFNGQPNGKNLFYKIFTDAERIDEKKNIFSALKIYYWLDNKKDAQWCYNIMSRIGISEFNRRYNLVFSSNPFDKYK